MHFNIFQYNCNNRPVKVFSSMVPNVIVLWLFQLEAMKQRLAAVTEDKYNNEDKVIKLSDELEKKVFHQHSYLPHIILLQMQNKKLYRKFVFGFKNTNALLIVFCNNKLRKQHAG